MSFSFSTLAQTVLKQRIWVRNEYHVNKISTIKNFPYPVPQGAKLKTVSEIKTKDENDLVVINTVTSEIVVGDTTTIIQGNKEIDFDLYPHSGGWANLAIDERDPSIMHVNYLLNHKNTIAKGRKYHIYDKEIKPDKTVDTIILQNRISVGDVYMYEKFKEKNRHKFENKEWFKYANYIEVLNKKDTTKIDYFLVDHFDRNSDYQLIAQNRDFFPFNTHKWDVGPITIPIKYRMGGKKNGNSYDHEFTADLNLGAFVGWTLWGKTRLRYEGEKWVSLTPTNFQIGGFLSLSTATLDTANTNTGKNPLKVNEKSTIGVITPGIGLMFGIANVNIGLFGGWDFGYGPESTNLNYHALPVPWIGFGLSYNLNAFYSK